MNAGNAGGLHDFADAPPGGDTGPIPQMDALAPVFAPLGLSQVMDHVEGVQKHRRRGNGPVNACTAFLERLEDDCPVFEVHAVSGQGQGFGYPTTGIRKSAAKCSDLASGIFGGFKERLALGWGQILALAVVIVKLLHEVKIPFETEIMPSVSG